MSIVQVLGAFLAGSVVIAGIAVIARPNSQFANVVRSSGDAISGILKAAKD